jgi:hypothetical protein
MELTNVWLRTLGDGLIRADQIVGALTHRTPAVAGKPAGIITTTVGDLDDLAPASANATPPSSRSGAASARSASSPASNHPPGHPRRHSMTDSTRLPEARRRAAMILWWRRQIKGRRR